MLKMAKESGKKTRDILSTMLAFSFSFSFLRIPWKGMKTREYSALLSAGATWNDIPSSTQETIEDAFEKSHTDYFLSNHISRLFSSRGSGHHYLSVIPKYIFVLSSWKAKCQFTNEQPRQKMRRKIDVNEMLKICWSRKRENYGSLFCVQNKLILSLAAHWKAQISGRPVPQFQ